MKKQIPLLVCCILALASCGRNNNDNEAIKVQIDSTAKASAIMEDEINRKKNDSIIIAIATRKADSIEHINKLANIPAPATANSVTPAKVQTVSPVNKKPANSEPAIKEPLRISDPPGAH